MNLRNFLLRICKGLHCDYRIMKSQLLEMPVSSQCLFRKRGLPVDIAERECIEAGYLNKDEQLLFVLRDVNNLKRSPFRQEFESESGCIPDDWTEEDYLANSTKTNWWEVGK